MLWYTIIKIKNCTGFILALLPLRETISKSGGETHGKDDADQGHDVPALRGARQVRARGRRRRRRGEGQPQEGERSRYADARRRRRGSRGRRHRRRLHRRVNVFLK